MHAILPFLCLGIGIDDMFVITQCWNNLKASKPSLSRERRLGLTLAHAGLSITVTSVTDIAAFGVGAVTLMPGLQVGYFWLYLVIFLCPASSPSASAPPPPSPPSSSSPSPGSSPGCGSTSAGWPTGGTRYFLASGTRLSTKRPRVRTSLRPPWSSPPTSRPSPLSPWQLSWSSSALALVLLVSGEV